MLDFWKNVKLQIKEKNTKQQAIAEQTGISLSTLRGWVSLDRLPDVVSAYKIAQALGVTVEYLVTGKDSSPHAETIAAIKKLISP